MHGNCHRVLEVSFFRLHHGDVHQGTATKPGLFDAVGISDRGGYVSRFRLRCDELLDVVRHAGSVTKFVDCAGMSSLEGGGEYLVGLRPMPCFHLCRGDLAQAFDAGSGNSNATGGSEGGSKCLHGSWTIPRFCLHSGDLA